MGFYARHILPRLIDLAMGNKVTTRLREVWIPRARGEVLEIGIGSGRNLPFYPAAVQHVYGVETEVLVLIRERTEMRAPSASSTRTNAIRFRSNWRTVLPAAGLCLTSAPTRPKSTVISTWTLCSIPNAINALSEMRRVLKPNGSFIFLEHGRAPDARVAAWQNHLTPIWKRFTGGCHLNRKIDDLITSAGFTINEIKTSYFPGPRPMTFMYQGLAARE